MFHKKQKEVCYIGMVWYLFSYWYYPKLGCCLRCIVKSESWKSLGKFLHNIFFDFLTVRLLKVTFPAVSMSSLAFISFHLLLTKCSSVNVKTIINVLFLLLLLFNFFMYLHADSRIWGPFTKSGLIHKKNMHEWKENQKPKHYTTQRIVNELTNKSEFYGKLCT